jgi:hypothetical protein
MMAKKSSGRNNQKPDQTSMNTKDIILKSLEPIRAIYPNEETWLIRIYFDDDAMPTDWNQCATCFGLYDQTLPLAVSQLDIIRHSRNPKKYHIALWHGEDAKAEFLLSFREEMRYQRALKNRANN